MSLSKATCLVTVVAALLGAAGCNSFQYVRDPTPQLEQMRYEYVRNNPGNKLNNDILAGKVQPGMSRLQVRVSWGEPDASDVPIRSKIVRETLRLENGYMIMPDAPGLGVDIDEEEIVKYPYQPHRIRHFTGALTDIRPVDETVYYSVQNAKRTRPQ